MNLSNKERKRNFTKDYETPIEDFEHRFPWLFKRMESFEEYDDDRVFIELSDGKTMIYDNFINELKEIKRFNDIYELSEEEWRIGFSKILRKQISSKNITQYELANKLGVSEMTISRYVTGRCLPSVYIINKLVRALNCKPEDLYPHDYIELN